MSEYLIQDTTLTAIGDAIRTKKSTSIQYSPLDMPEAIESITTGITPEGNIELSQQTGTDVSDYATASVRSASVSLNTPSINSSTGVVTASVSVGTTGWIGLAPSNKTLQLTTQAAKTVTPNASSQTAVAAGRYTTGAVTVAAVPSETKTVELSMASGNQTVTNTSGKWMTSVTVQKPSTLVAENIKKDVNIGGVIGTLESGGGEDLPDAEDYTFGTFLMPAKGDIITMNLDGSDKEYLVLKIDGSVAEVLARESVNDSITFNSGSCFIAGTQVSMADGSTKNIENVVIGDHVISYDVDSKENYETIVKGVITRENAVDMATLTLEDNTTLTMTAYHPIYTEDGWHSITQYNGYPELVIGDRVKVIDGYKELININRFNSGPITVYSINVIDEGEDPDVEENDNFYVNNIMVHNAKPRPSMGSNVYSGGELDTYLNTTYYSTLSTDAKTAIVDKNLIQYQYSYNGFIYDENTHASYANYSTKSQKAVVGDRHIYALGVEDIEEYFNNTFGESNIQEMFNTTEIETILLGTIWLSSASADDSESAWEVCGDIGYLDRFSALIGYAARPAFQIDLTKIEWTPSN